MPGQKRKKGDEKGAAGPKTKMDGDEGSLNSAETIAHLDKFVQNINQKTDSQVEIVKMRTMECEKIEDCNNKVMTLIKLFSDDSIHNPKTEENVAQLTEEVNQLKRSIQELTEHNQVINKKMIADHRNLDLNLQLENKKLKAASDMLSYIFDCGLQVDENPNVLKGVIKGRSGVQKPFSVDTGGHSQYFVTNYLWDLIAE